ncbi:hypothetical protein ABZ714_09770 [Streptomyces sp. NPDC006798]
MVNPPGETLDKPAPGNYDGKSTEEMIAITYTPIRIAVAGR